MHLLFSTILLFLISRTYPQQILNLPDCLEYAFKHNLELLEYSNNIDKSRIILKQSYLNLLPSVNAEYNHYLNSGRSLNVETYSWDNQDIQQGNMALSAELLVFNGLNNLYNKQASQIALDRSNLALLQQKLLLGIDITLLFHKVSLTNLNVSILEVTNSNTNEEIEKMEEQITAGSVAKSNIYELKAQAKKEALEILGLQNEIEKYINNLSKLLNWKEESRLQLEADGLSYIDDSVLIYKVLFVKNGIIDKSVITFVAEKEKDLANKAVQLQKSHAYPGISANASFSSRYLKDAFDPVSGENNYTYINQLDNNQYRQVALTLRIPVFNRYQNTTEIKLLKIDYENKKLQLEGVKKQLSVELDNIQTDIMYCARKIQETEELVDAYKKSFEAASEKYHSGLLDSYTLNTSKNNFTGSMLQLNKLKVELSMNIELLKLYYKFTL